MRNLLAVVVLVALTVGIAPVCAEEPPVPDSTPVYKKIGDVELKLHVFNPEGHKPTDTRPAIVFFHGGGWQHGDPNHFYERCEYLAQRGMVAMSAQYRVVNVHGIQPRECVQDARSAMRWVRGHAKELGIDPKKIAAGGASAGGQMAAAAAFKDGLDEPGEDTEVSSRPDALVLFAAPLDTGPDGFAYRWVRKYWQQFSPIHNIDKDTPPTLLLFGTEDGITSVETIRSYEKKMAEADVRCDVRLYEGQPHRFHVRHINERLFVETLIETDRFLASLGYLEGEPTLEPLPEPKEAEPETIPETKE